MIIRLYRGKKKKKKVLGINLRSFSIRLEIKLCKLTSKDTVNAKFNGREKLYLLQRGGWQILNGH